MNKRYPLSALFLFAAGMAVAETSMWKVSKGDGVFYLGGTCHVLRPSDFPLPEAFDRAYGLADRVVMEVDMGKVATPEFQRKVLSRSVYPDGSTVKDHLSEEAYRALEEYCEANRLPLEGLRPLRVSTLVMTLTMMELQKHGVTAEGVDMTYYQKAIADGKPVEGLETVEEQLDFITGMAEGHEDAFVLHSVRQLKTLEREFDALIKSWRAGDHERIDEVYLGDMREKMPDLYQSLIVTRNENWMPKLEALLEREGVELVLVGVAHLVGKHGLISMLEAKGCVVEKF